MSERRPPELSVVLVTPDGYATIAKTLRHLRAQTARDRIEVVIVAPSRDRLGLDRAEPGALAGFHGSQVVEAGPVESTGDARAAGVRAARAPVVALAEDHSYPDPEWAAALIAAHRQPRGAVGPAIANANPESMTSWAELLMDFGRWVAPVAAWPVDDVPWHNSAYRRALLLEYGPQLGPMLEAAGVLHRDLAARGHQLYLEPAATTRHLNISRPASSLRHQFHSGRLFAAVRARDGRWSARRRLLYIGGAPLIPPLRLRGILRELRRPGRRRDLLPRVLPALLLGVVAHTVGEVAGYAFGAGGAHRRKSDFELRRHRFLTERDRRADAAG